MNLSNLGKSSLKILTRAVPGIEKEYTLYASFTFHSLGGRPLSEDYGSGQKYNITSRGLQILDTTRSDEGLYVCAGTNPGGQRESQGYLEVFGMWYRETCLEGPLP